MAIANIHNTFQRVNEIYRGINYLAGYMRSGYPLGHYSLLLRLLTHIFSFTLTRATKLTAIFSK